MAESDFAKIANHKDKMIKELTFIGGKTGIKWQQIERDADGEEHINGCSIESSGPARDAFNDAVDSLKPYIIDYLIEKADRELKEYWEVQLFITKLSFSITKAGKAAKIYATFLGGDNNKTSFVLPAVDLYNPEVRTHQNGSAITYGEGYTKIIEQVIQESKIYLSGDRGAMQQTLKEETEPAAE